MAQAVLPPRTPAHLVSRLPVPGPGAAFRLPEEWADQSQREQLPVASGASKPYPACRFPYPLWLVQHRFTGQEGVVVHRGHRQW
jgi:hypothetical protein